MKGGISVIIPAFNRENLIGNTLQSILAQSVAPMEVLVVDDGSTDRTAEVAESFGPRIAVIRQKNQGPAAARNRGVRESCGEYIHFFDSDDVAAPNKHEVQLEALQGKNADIAYGPWVKGAFSGDSFFPENGVFQQNGLPEGDLVKALLCNWSIVPHACLFRRTIVEKSGGFPEDLFVAEDQMMFLKCLLEGAKVVHTPGTLEMYRVENTDKITASEEGAVKRLVEWGRFLVKSHRLCEKYGYKPHRWLDFQGRVFSAFRELEELEFEGKDKLLGDLEQLFFKSRKPIYRARQVLHQKIQGLRSRVFGTRGPRSLQIGKLTPVQTNLIQQSGYTTDR